MGATLSSVTVAATHPQAGSLGSTVTAAARARTGTGSNVDGLLQTARRMSDRQLAGVLGPTASPNSIDSADFKELLSFEGDTDM